MFAGEVQGDVEDTVLFGYRVNVGGSGEKVFDAVEASVDD